MLFGFVGPPIGGIAAFGLIGLVAVPGSYALGLMPALIASATFSTAWLLGLGERNRVIWTIVVGVLSSALSTIGMPEQGQLPFMAWGGGVAALFCALLANLMIRRTERERPR